MATALNLKSLAVSKRSRIAAGLVFATFVLLCLTRLGREGGILLFRRPGPGKAHLEEQPGYNGPRFELFGIRDIAAEVEVATLNIKAKEESSSSPSSSSSPPSGASFDPLEPDNLSPQSRPKPDAKSRPDHESSNNPRRHSSRQLERSYSYSSSPLQRRLPIALPKFATHHLNSPTFNITDLDLPIPGVPPATITLDIPPKPKQPDASNIVFGVATLLDRLPDTLRNFAHWGAHTNARFVVVHEPRNTTLRPGEPTPDEVRLMYREAGLDHITLVERDAGWGERFLGLLNLLNQHLEVQTEWAVLIDDDTFFFDMDVVLDMLNKYDPAKPWYVGTLSDNKWNVNNGGLFAMGGAGVFISRPLLQTVGPLAASCFPKDTTAGGDTLVGECIHRHTTTKLTLEHGLYQLDLHGDVTGFYEAARQQPVSVHHWKSWHHHDLPTIGSVAQSCGRPCVLQNFLFQDEWQMANGFSIYKYSYNETELARQHPQAMEHTWKLTEWDIEDSWKYSLAPLKERDENKVQFLLERSVIGDGGELTLYYVKRRFGVGTGIIRVVWR